MGIELLDIIASSVPVGLAPGPNDMTILVQADPISGLPRLVKVPMAQKAGGTIGASPLLLDMGALGYLGYAELIVQPNAAGGDQILIETSRTGSSGPWNVVGAGPWATRISYALTRESTDVNFITHVRLTRVAGSTVQSRWTLTNGVVSIASTQEESRGYTDAFNLVVDTTTRIAFPDSQTFRGRKAKSLGTFNNIIQIRSEVFDPWDSTNGDPLFAFQRCSNATCDVEAFPSVNLGTAADQSAMLAKALRPDTTATQVGDHVTRLDSVGGIPNTIWTLTTAGVGTFSHWTQNPAGLPGSVTVINLLKVPPVLGQIVVCEKFAPNQWSIQ